MVEWTISGKVSKVIHTFENTSTVLLNCFSIFENGEWRDSWKSESWWNFMISKSSELLKSKQLMKINFDFKSTNDSFEFLWNLIYFGVMDFRNSWNYVHWRYEACEHSLNFNCRNWKLNFHLKALKKC